MSRAGTANAQPHINLAIVDLSRSQPPEYSTADERKLAFQLQRRVCSWIRVAQPMHVVRVGDAAAAAFRELELSMAGTPRRTSTSPQRDLMGGGLVLE